MAEKVIEWKEVAKKVSSNTGEEVKKINDIFGATRTVVTDLMVENRPSKVGDTTVVMTPMSVFKVERMEAGLTSFDTSSGEEYIWPETFAVGAGVPVTMRESVNDDIKPEKKESSKTKTA